MRHPWLSISSSWHTVLGRQVGACLAACALLAGCASAPKPELHLEGRWAGDEATAIGQAAQAKEGERVSIEGVSYYWGKAYFAASGRRCRLMTPVSGDSGTRAACVHSERWELVPSVGRPREAGGAAYAERAR